MGPRRVGDPCLVAGHGPVVAHLHCTGAQRAQVRSGIRLGEHGRGQDLGAGDAGQPPVLLCLGAAAQDQLGRDFRARGERSHADIATAQLFRHDGHRRLRQSESAVFLRDRQAEHAQFAQLRDHLHGDQRILKMPAMRMRGHLFHREPAELRPHHLQLVVQPRGPACGAPVLVPDQRHQPAARRLAIGLLRQAHHLRNHQRAHVLLAQPRVLQPHDLALAHLDAAVDLPEVFPEGDLVDQRLQLAKRSLTGQPFGPVLHLAQRLRIGGQPRHPVRGGLMRLDRRHRDAAL